MLSKSENSRTAWQYLSMAAMVLGAMTITATAASAGQCPAGKIVADGNGQKPGATMPKDVTDTVLSSIDLAGEPAGIKDRKFRLRKLVIQPGGVVPSHSHADRPALIYIVEGEVTEYASTCAVPILHKAGETAPETHATAHWWKNTGKKTVVLLSADLLHNPADEHTM
jgi:quercetin dioxygenase-like cupin family protein